MNQELLPYCHDLSVNNHLQVLIVRVAPVLFSSGLHQFPPKDHAGLPGGVKLLLIHYVTLLFQLKFYFFKFIQDPFFFQK